MITEFDAHGEVFLTVWSSIWAAVVVYARSRGHVPSSRSRAFRVTSLEMVTWLSGALFRLGLEMRVGVGVRKVCRVRVRRGTPGLEVERVVRV